MYTIYHMRHHLPNKKIRQKVVSRLKRFYEKQSEEDFRSAIGIICDFYHINHPSVDWYEYLERGRTWGLTYEDGVIHLICPTKWKDSKKSWVLTVLHEMHHYLFWVNKEDKADDFAAKFMAGA